ncbi:MAG: TetR family transcriptional regulator [Rhodobacteraceae bacterium]|nr:TetR family transcriptional regulator [Paracoccaceae bacterium]
MTARFKKRDVILEHANRLFSDKGFAATSLEDIAEAVGIKRESLYYYYPSRYDLLYDIIEPQIAQVRNNFDAIVADNADFRTTVCRAIGSHLQHFNASYLHMAMAVRKNSKDDVEVKFIRLRDMFKAYENAWIDMIRVACDRGEVVGDTTPKMMVYSILGLCNSLSSWYRPEGDISLDQLGRHFSALILDGIALT